MDPATPVTDRGAQPSAPRLGRVRGTAQGLLALVAVAASAGRWGQWADIIDQLKLAASRRGVAALRGGAARRVHELPALARDAEVLGSTTPHASGREAVLPHPAREGTCPAVWPARPDDGPQPRGATARMGLAFLLTLGLADPGRDPGRGSCLPASAQAEGWVVLLGLLAVPVLLAPLPPVLNTLLDRALRLLRRPGLDAACPAGLARGVGWAIAFWVVYGGHVWVLGRGLGADRGRPPVAIGGFAIVSSGRCSSVLPAGAGVREAVLVVLRQFIQARLAQQAPHRRDARIILQLARRRPFHGGVGIARQILLQHFVTIGHHGAKLVAAENIAVPAHPTMGVLQQQQRTWFS